MHNIALEIAYEGTDFLGWQKAEGPSIENSLEEAIFATLGAKPKLQAASRTDRGVHALGQIINFHLDTLRVPLKNLPLALNAKLPHSIRVFSARLADPSFHPTLDNCGKTYTYQIDNHPIQRPKTRNTHWHIHTPLNLSAMRNAIPHFLGKHDFATFTNISASPREETAREIESIAISSDFTITIRGRSFLYKMVRNIVGTLVAIGKGELSPDDVPALFTVRDRKKAPMTAPAHGLTLTCVHVAY